MDQKQLLGYLIDSLKKIGIEYLLVGATASSIFGEPRFTFDIDVVVNLLPEQVSLLKKAFPEEEFYFDEEAAQEAIRGGHQFNIIHPQSGLKIDLMIKKDDPFDDSRFSRKKIMEIMPGIEAAFASPEDLIIKKMDYYRRGSSEKHLRDIAGIIKICDQELDYHYINFWAKNLSLGAIWESIKKHLHKPL